MPACRTNNKAKRAPGAESQLVWAIDKLQAPAVSVSVSVDITPADADSSSDTTAMPPLVDYPPSTGEFIMFPPPSSTSSPARRTPHSKKKPENHIPRPPNAFILFRSSFIKSQHVSTAVETNHSTLSKIIGLTWSSMREEERQVWYGKAKEALDEHRRRFPKYAFRPTQTKARAAPGTGGGNSTSGTGVGMGGGADAVWVGGEKEKRRVREVEPKDITRCAKIAQLLVEGKKGAELNAAVEEFDRTHVPQIVTRFEAPITARAFRRSSSAPVPDGGTGEGSGFLAHVQNVKAGTTKPRARSTRPARSASPPNASANANSHSAGSPTGDMPLPQDPAPFAFSEFTFDSNAPLPASPLELELECDPLSPFAAFTAQPFSPTSFSSPAPSYSTPSTTYSTPEQSFVTPSHSHSHSHSHAYSTSSTASAVAAAAGLTIDTSFSHHTWAAPQTPQTPYMSHTATTTTLSSPISLSSPVSMTSSPTALSSPISTHSPSPFGSASSAFDAFDAFFADPFPTLCGADGVQDAISQAQHAMSQAQHAMPSLSMDMDMGMGMMCGEAGLGGSYTSYADTSYLGMGVDMGLGMGLGLGLGLGLGDDMNMGMNVGGMGMSIDAMGFAEYLRVPASYA